MGIIAVVLQTRAMVGVEVAHRDPTDPLEIDRKTGCQRCFAEHLADRVWALDQEPVVVQPECQASGVIPGRERLPYPKRNQVDVAHRGSRRRNEKKAAIEKAEDRRAIITRREDGWDSIGRQLGSARSLSQCRVVEQRCEPRRSPFT